MKKIILFLICLFPLYVKADNGIKCYSTSSDKPLVLESTENFPCSGIKGDKLTFKNNDTDISKYFEYVINEDGSATITIKDKSLVFNTEFEYGIVVISDNESSTPIYIKNNAYVKPTEPTTTNTNEITYKVILDNQGNKEEKTCSVKNEGDTCYITLPNLDEDGFNGWGKSASCKDGNKGSTKVNENITYYACYENNEKEEQKNSELYLKTLKIFDDNKKEIKFGTFSIKKREYSFKVLNEVESLEIEATSDENIKIEYQNNDKLVTGENEVIITLTDENNNVSEYKLIVTRLKVGETINNVNYLKALVIGNYNIDFNKEVFNYYLTIDKDIDKLVINAKAFNENDKIEIKNNNNLEDGSIININVLNEEGNITTYNINITKESNNILLYLAIGLIILLIIILIILIIIKRKQKKKLDNVKSNDAKHENNIEVLNL